jgi:hypothetical protein
MCTHSFTEGKVWVPTYVAKERCRCSLKDEENCKKGPKTLEIGYLEEQGKKERITITKSRDGNWREETLKGRNHRVFPTELPLLL